MKIIFSLLFLFQVMTINAQSFYDLEAKTIDGKTFKFEQLKGKKVMIVNTASKCGYTPQYADLEKLYEAYKDSNFVIIGFPANDFLRQEPGTNEEIKSFCTLNYGVTFPMMAKIHVKRKEIHPVYQWLTKKEKNGVLDSKIKWNFQKYIINENGKLLNVFYSKTKPFDEAILKLL
ncbi:MAG: glutathione peroxidase [Bacteroidales bacterium]|nr:glutathione peroxidase [Bacteroidales bacterium]